MSVCVCVHAGVHACVCVHACTSACLCACILHIIMCEPLLMCTLCVSCLLNCRQHSLLQCTLCVLCFVCSALWRGRHFTSFHYYYFIGWGFVHWNFVGWDPDHAPWFHHPICQDTTLEFRLLGLCLLECCHLWLLLSQGKPCTHSRSYHTHALTLMNTLKTFKGRRT